ncbi:MAG: GAF domain-containing protein [Deltaproteobacteria bacterium]|nr:MAG: GAF domain-containing protein [Deltaproteobacteria bacterium]
MSTGARAAGRHARMNILATSSLLAALVTLAIGASVLLRDRTRKTYTSFASFTFTLALWHLLNFVARATGSELFAWLALWPAATIPPTALRFFRHFLAEPRLGGKPRPPRVTLVWTVAAYLALIYSAIRALTGRTPIHGELWFQIPFGAYVFGGLYRCVLDLYLQYRATVTKVEKTRIRYLMLGGLVSITLALTDYLPQRFGIAWPTIGNVLTILYLYFLSQTLFRYRLLDLNELVGKIVVLGTLVVLLSAVYGLLLAWVGGGQEGLFLLNTLVASFVILILFEPVRTRLENSINRWLLRQRHELRGRLERLRASLVNVVNVNTMVHIILAALEESRRVTHASVYLLDSDGGGYDLAGHYGEKPIERIEAAAYRPLLDRLREGPIDIDTLRRELEFLEAASASSQKTAIESLDAIARAMDDMHASIVVPMLGSEETEKGPWLLGLIAVRDERADTAFGVDEIDLFAQVAAQAALTIENTQAFEQMKERDRLADIGQMAAGLAHEIRNPLGAIKGAAQLLVGPDGAPIKSQQDISEFLDIIIQETDRLNKVVTQFLDYARPARGETSDHVQVDLNEVVRKTVQLLEASDDAANVEITVKLDDLLPPVAGDPEQLRQVFLNLGLNALQAMPDGGHLEIITTRRRRSALGYGSFAEVRFRDTGPGIPRDKRKNLFIPFYTTKQKGTGLGLAISQRIVTQHNGTIEVRSREGHGATFSVFLPALGPSLAPRTAEQVAESPTQPLHALRADVEPEEPTDPGAGTDPGSDPGRPRADTAEPHRTRGSMVESGEV